MPASPSRITFVTQEYRRAIAGPDATVVTKYGAAARDSGAEPIETFFDTVADAAAMATERLDLLKSDRRRFRATVASAAFGLGLDASQQTPTMTLIDDERQFSGPAIVVDMQIDLAAETTSLGVWG